jgi:hypothetical protein
MRLTFDAQNAQRNHWFVVVPQGMGLFPEQKRPRYRGHFHKKFMINFR